MLGRFSFVPEFSAIDPAGRTAAVVAVSGGGDSLALLLLLDAFLRQRPDLPLRLLAVTVDHGLRPEAAEEARQVAAFCANLGIPHRVMRWDGPKPASRISEAAREARQRLLAQAATDAGADIVFLAHTADDQVETVAMRMARGGGRGLAGIAPATLYENRVWFLRPLLGARRADLRSFLAERNVRWIEDPSNTNPRYERARVRRALSEEEIARLLAVARDAAERREALGREVAAWFQEYLRLSAPGLLSFPVSAMRAAPRDVQVYAFRLLLACAGGASQLPDESRASAMLVQLLEEPGRATLSRAIAARQRDRIYLCREGRNLPRQSAENGALWDNRFRVRVHGLPADHGVAIAPRGRERLPETDLPDGALPTGLVRAALAAEPVLERNGEALPSLDGVCLQRVIGPWATLVPSFDYDLAAALSSAIGGEILPAKPWLCHKQG